MANKKDSTSQQKYKAPALEKGLEILEALAAHRSGLSLTDLAKQLDRSKSELFRPLATLEARGYINRDESTAVYSLSLRLYELAHKHPPVVNLLNAANLPMELLASGLNESCHLSVLRKGKLVVLKESLSPARVRLSVPVGGRFSPINTVSGRLLLAQLPQDELKELLNNSEDYSGLAETEQKQLLGRLSEIREAGVSTAVSETHLGISDAAVLVGNPQIGLVAALAVASLRAAQEKDHFEEIINLLKQTAQTITEKMGLDHDSNNLL